MKSFFHYCCRGLKTDLIFADEREFIAGMNRIGVCYLYCIEKGMPVQIVAFCLLGNHFHFVLYGTEEATELFMDYFTKQTARWTIANREDKFHGNLEVGHWPALSRERVREKVVYTLRQTLEAGLQLVPQGYPWSSAGLMFCGQDYILGCCRKVVSLSGRERKNLFNTSLSIPEDWNVLPFGMIWPGNYTDIETAQRLFSGVKDYMYCLNNGNIDKNVYSEMFAESPSIPDMELKDKANAMAGALFGRKSIGSCSADERIKVAIYLRKELHCGHKQLARIVMMDEDVLRKTV